MRAALIAVILAALGVMSYNTYQWYETQESKKNKEKIQHLSIDGTAHIIKTHHIGVNWNPQSQDGILVLHPGYIRNRTNPESAREFLLVVNKLKSNPWLVLPSNLTPNEYSSLGHLLKDEGITHAMVEIDNSNPEQTEKAFETIVESAGRGVHIKKVLSSSKPEADQMAQTFEKVPSADYWLVNSHQDLEQMVNQSRKIGKKIAILENDSDGNLLGKEWIEELTMKIQPQIVNVNNKNDSAALALRMMNLAILGPAHKIHHSHDNPKLTGLAFKSTNKWAAAFYNDSDKTEEIELEFPKDDRLMPHVVLTLSSDNNHEIKRSFADCCKNRLVTFSIPPHSFVVLPPQKTLTESTLTTKDG